MGGRPITHTDTACDAGKIGASNLFVNHLSYVALRRYSTFFRGVMGHRKWDVDPLTRLRSADLRKKTNLRKKGPD
jgi:hypothetical protein